MSKLQGWKGVLTELDQQERTFAVIGLLINATGAAVIWKIPQEQRLMAFFGVIALLAVIVGAVLKLKLSRFNVIASSDESPYAITPQAPPSALQPSRGNPENQSLDDLINSFIHASCRSVSVPHAPDKVDLRAFVFKREGDELVCSHYWALNPTDEKVNILRFSITAAVGEDVAVVQALLKKRICRREIGPLPEDFAGKRGKLKKSLEFVIAAPIYRPDGEVWGTIDLDTGNEKGAALLATVIGDAAMRQLASHMEVILGLSAKSPESVPA